MELLFEIIFSIIFESSTFDGLIERMKAKKSPMWVRIGCKLFASLTILLMIGLIATPAVLIWKDQLLLSILFLFIDLIFVIYAIRKLKTKEKEEQESTTWNA